MRPVGNVAGMRYAGSAAIPARTAVLSPDRVYRYSLGRRWGSDPRTLLWVMLNPSTADAAEDDPTIRRCRGLATEQGFEAFEVVNLFALRTSDPTRLARAADPVGPGNDAAIAALAAQAALVVCAWGAMAFARERAREVGGLLRQHAPGPLCCFGVTRSGAPKHPLYLRAGTPLVPFRLRLLPSPSPTPTPTSTPSLPPSPSPSEEP